jgi:hypothetical protein
LATARPHCSFVTHTHAPKRNLEQKKEINSFYYWRLLLFACNQPSQEET